MIGVQMIVVDLIGEELFAVNQIGVQMAAVDLIGEELFAVSVDLVGAK